MKRTSYWLSNKIPKMVSNEVPMRMNKIVYMKGPLSMSTTCCSGIPLGVAFLSETGVSIRALSDFVMLSSLLLECSSSIPEETASVLDASRALTISTFWDSGLTSTGSTVRLSCMEVVTWSPSALI